MLEIPLCTADRKWLDCMSASSSFETTAADRIYLKLDSDIRAAAAAAAVTVCEVVSSFLAHAPNL